MILVVKKECPELTAMRYFLAILWVLWSIIPEVCNDAFAFSSLTRSNRLPNRFEWILNHGAVSTWKTSMGSTITKQAPLVNFLETDPYYDISSIPINTYTPKNPYVGRILDVKLLTKNDKNSGIYHVTVCHDGKMPYREGQSFGIKLDGANPLTGKSHNVRLYSIASSRYGDDGKGISTTFCIRRAIYIDPVTGLEDASRRGVCSTKLCDALPGDEVLLTGPTGKLLLLPENSPASDVIMVATGTGVAPFRSFAHRLFFESNPAANAFSGLAWLFLGVPTTDALLFKDEWTKIKAANSHNFRFDVAISREMQNSKGEKLYIQDKIAENGNEIFERMEKGGHIYFCGLKKMMPGILETFSAISESKGLVWKDVHTIWKKRKQWHVEVY